MPTVGFELTISAGERSQTYAWDRAATGIGYKEILDKGFSHSSISKFYLNY